MTMNQYFDRSTKAGMAAGALLSIFSNINSADFLKTAVLAAFGAIVSLVVSILLKRLIKLFRK